MRYAPGRAGRTREGTAGVRGSIRSGRAAAGFMRMRPVEQAARAEGLPASVGSDRNARRAELR